MKDLLGEPINWDAMPAGQATRRLYDLADYAPLGSALRAEYLSLAARYASKHDAKREVMERQQERRRAARMARLAAQA